MADELASTATTVPAPGGPVTINVHAAPNKKSKPEPSAEAAGKSEPKQLRAGKAEKRKALVEEAETKGANRVLKAAGVKKSERGRVLEELKAGRLELAEKKKEAESAKAEASAASAQVDALKPYQERMKKYADAEFASLPEKYQKALAEMKIDDPMSRLDMIEVWKRTGVIDSPAAGAATAASTTAAKPPSTTLAATASPQAASLPALNHYDTWKQMKDSGQTFMAAQYLEAHQKKILEQRPK